MGPMPREIDIEEDRERKHSREQSEGIAPDLPNMCSRDVQRGEKSSCMCVCEGGGGTSVCPKGCLIHALAYSNNQMRGYVTAEAD